MLKRKKKNGQSTMEYVTLIMFILASFLVFQKYIVRGLSGRMKGVGDSFAQGRLYDPNVSAECAYDYIYHNQWYDSQCYDANCEGACLRVTATPAACSACIQNCININPLCNV